MAKLLAIHVLGLSWVQACKKQVHLLPCGFSPSGDRAIEGDLRWQLLDDLQGSRVTNKDAPYFGGILVLAASTPAMRVRFLGILLPHGHWAGSRRAPIAWRVKLLPEGAPW